MNQSLASADLSLQSRSADVFIPHDGITAQAALARTTHLCIGAHPDDIEAMAYHGVASCFGREDRWFTGIILTHGSGSARAHEYAHYTDEQMIQVRRREQQKAAFVGDYSLQIQLGYGSAEIKSPDVPALSHDLSYLLHLATPEVVYLHQPADKHDTHIATLAHSLKALRTLPPDKQPKVIYGCEGWRNLDWLCDNEKILLDVSAHPGLGSALMGVFDSQNTGGKRYDLALPARRSANATFHNPHTVDAYQGITWAVDLTPLIKDPTLSPLAFVQAQIDRFRADVTQRMQRYCYV
ncbi:MAG TPA: PIG-L family deacetylase [Opitutaceae bacterium]|nr:PIG-L family deacetylase [Opitutaceae bacterium]